MCEVQGVRCAVDSNVMYLKIGVDGGIRMYTSSNFFVADNALERAANSCGLHKPHRLAEAFMTGNTRNLETWNLMIEIAQSRC